MQARHLVAGDVVHTARVTILTAPSVVRVYLGAVMPSPRWAIGGGMTHVVYPRGWRLIEDVWLGCVYAWLCTSATVEGLARGRACWAAGQIENRPTPVNGCPQDDPVAEHLAAGTLQTGHW